MSDSTGTDLDLVLDQAVAAGRGMLKAAFEAEWGGYSGYFADPDGYPWEVAWGEVWEFEEDGTPWGGPRGSRPTR